MNTERTEKFVNAIACDLEEGGFRQVSGTTLRRTLATAVTAAMPLLEAGNPVSRLAGQQAIAEFLKERDEALGCPDATDAERAESARLIAALAATGKQQVGEHAGWNAVCEVLDEVDPNWAMRGAALDTESDQAVAAIRKMAQAQQVGEVQGDARAQFEAWHCEKFKTRWQTGAPTRDMHNGVYAEKYGPAEQQVRWEAWQVAWQAALAARQPGAQVPVCSGGFVIGNGSGEKYMAWGQVGPEWTPERSAALWLVRRADAEALAAENEDAWLILPVERCALPPNGWACTLASGHEGPCPTIAAPPAQGIDLGQLPRYSKSYSEGIYRDDSGDWVKWEDLHALIDQRDAAPGVGS